MVHEYLMHLVTRFDRDEIQLLSTTQAPHDFIVTVHHFFTTGSCTGGAMRSWYQPLVVLVALVCVASTSLVDAQHQYHTHQRHTAQSAMQLTVHADAVLGMRFNQLQQILDELAADEHTYEPTNDEAFDTLLENFFVRLQRHLFAKVRSRLVFATPMHTTVAVMTAQDPCGFVWA